MSAKRSLCLLVNERAAADDRLRSAVAELRQEGHRIEVRALWEPGQGEQFAAECMHHGGFEAIVACGGDGTLNEAVNGIMADAPESPPMIGVLPYGTANDFARSANIPADDPAAALRIAAYAQPHRLDLGRANDRWFLNAATVGIGAEITADTPKPLKDLLGGAAYSVNALSKLIANKPRQARVLADDLHWKGDLLLLIVANAHTAGGGQPIAPKDAPLDDGLLNVTVVSNARTIDLAEALAHLFTRGRPDHPAILQRQVSWLELQAEMPVTLNLDGESMEVERCRFEVWPRALPVLTG